MEIKPGRDAVFGSWPDGQPIELEAVPTRPTRKRRPRADSYDDEVAGLICERLGDGEKLRDICRDNDMPSKATVFRWIGNHPEFNIMYEAALMARFEDRCDELEAIAADSKHDYETDPESDDAQVREKPESLGRSKLRIETIKWRMAKELPKKYGEPAPVVVAPSAPADACAAPAPQPRPTPTVQDGVAAYRENLRLVGK